MTVLQLMMLLHYSAIAEPYSLRHPKHANSSAVAEQRQWLINDNLLVEDDKWGSGYQLTERGRAFVEALKAMPLPICKWEVPNAACL